MSVEEDQATEGANNHTSNNSLYRRIVEALESKPAYVLVLESMPYCNLRVHVVVALPSEDRFKS
jgi:hypothetical protein